MNKATRKSSAAELAQPRQRSVKSADRVLDLLELLAGTGRPMSHTELAQRTQIPKGSLTPLLRNLAERGYVERLPDTPRFRLGDATYALARRGAHARGLVAASEPWLRRLVSATGESAGLSVLRGDVAERVAAAQSRKAILYSLHVGVLQPLYASSAGKILLAWMPAGEREDYLARVRFEPRTEQTIRSASVLRRQLRSVREEGIAWSIGEFTTGIAGVAAPVLDVHGRAAAAVGVALPVARLDEERKRKLVHSVQEIAGQIARVLAAD
ncbi:MAG: IclR family transcriptional regulator [Burkholderiales bacterium]|nr:IclR family transcriptional regulator [Burkholderiales bacterium]